MDPMHHKHFLFSVVILTVLSEIRATDTIEQPTQVIELHASVHEERPVGQVIMRLAEEIERYDRKAHRNFRLPTENTRFHLLPSPDASLFHINSDGSLVNAKRLDYEELCDSTRLSKRVFSQPGQPRLHDSLSRSPFCLLKVRILILQTTSAGLRENQSGQRQLRTVAVTITLIDTNDNRPTCVLNQPQKLDSTAFSGSDAIEVAENTPIGTVLAVWKLSDRDTTPNGITDARLFGSKNGKSALLGSGELPFRLQFAQAMGPWSTVDVKLILTNSVEYIDQPSTSHDYTNELDVYHLKIIILDSKDNTDVVSWNTATVPSNTAISCHLQVRIVDINDHSPVWVSPMNFVNGQPLELELTESKSYAQRELVRLKATDADRGANSRITYQWAPRVHHNTTHRETGLSTESDQDILSRLFYLDATSGSLQLRGTNVDFESVSRLYSRHSATSVTPGRIALTLRVVAVDQPVNQSEQRMSSVGVVVVWLVDVNDNSPQIQIIGLHSSTDLPNFPFPMKNTPAYPQIVYISENLPENEPVAFITVTDEDSEAHGGLSCTLHQSTFNVKQPDVQAFQLIKLTQQITSEESSHAYLLPENFQASDVSRSVNYKLITTKRLDREKVSSYHLNFTCTDSLLGSVTSSSMRLTSYRMVEVLVTDVNDNPPRIIGVIDRSTGKLNKNTTVSGSFMCSVCEHATIGTKICQLQAEDLDQSGVTNRGSEKFQWWLDDSVRSLIDVERDTGWLVVQLQQAQSGQHQATSQLLQLDREIMTELSFTVYVQDSSRRSEEQSLTASATVLLRITDINDHVPKISEYNYFQISESAAPGTVIGTLVALDGDEPDSPNSAITYHIYSYGESFDNTGIPYQRDLSRTTHLSTDASVNELRDIKLDEKTGTMIVGPNGLDRERQSAYKFVVAVSDGAAVSGKPALSPRERHVVQTVVHVTVEDENDNAPRIIYPESHTATFTLACPIFRQQLPHTIAQIVVNDSDSGINAEVFYHLSPMLEQSAVSSTAISPSEMSISANESLQMNETTAPPTAESNQITSGTITLMPFQIDPQNGLLMVIHQPLDEQNRELCGIDRSQVGPTVLANYQVRVVVSDRGIPSLSSSVVLHIRIVSNAPMENVESSLRQPGQIPPRALDRLKHHVESSSHRTDGTNQRLHKLYSPSSSKADSRSGIDSPLLSSLGSPDVFWAATICLTIATGVLIFLIVLITMITCHRRMKPVQQNTGETRQNEWVQPEEGTYDSRYESRPFDNVEMNISKNSPVISNEHFPLHDDPNTNVYLWTGRIKSTGNSPDLLGTGYRGSPKLNSSGYPTLITTIPHCRTLQNPLVQRSDIPRIDLLMRSSPCANYEGYQKLIPTPQSSEPEHRVAHENKFCSPAPNTSHNQSDKMHVGRIAPPTFRSEEDLRKATLSHTVVNGNTLTRAVTPTVFENLTQQECDTLAAAKAGTKSSGKKKNEVSFV